MYHAVMKPLVAIFPLLFLRMKMCKIVWQTSHWKPSSIRSSRHVTRCVKICNYSSLWESNSRQGALRGNAELVVSPERGFCDRESRLATGRGTLFNREFPQANLASSNGVTENSFLLYNFIKFHYRVGGVLIRARVMFPACKLIFRVRIRSYCGIYVVRFSTPDDLIPLSLSFPESRWWPREMWQPCTSDRGRWRISD